MDSFDRPEDNAVEEPIEPAEDNAAEEPTEPTEDNAAEEPTEPTEDNTAEEPTEPTEDNTAEEPAAPIDGSVTEPEEPTDVNVPEIPRETPPVYAPPYQQIPPYQQVPPYMVNSPYPQYYNGNFYPPRPQKEKLNTSVKVVLTVGICATVLCAVLFIAYWAVNGRENMFSMLFEEFSGYYEEFEPTFPTFGEDDDPPIINTAPEDNPYINPAFSLELKENDIDKNEAGSFRHAYDRITVSTVAVAIAYEDEEFDVQGSGIILSRDGYVLTNSHVIDDGEEMSYQIILYDSTDLLADLVGCDPRTDLAVLKIRNPEAADLVPAEFADSDQLLIGEEVIAVGNPGGIKFQNSLSTGVVSALNRTVSADTMGTFIQTNAAINPGNSGGPLANLSGQVIGVNTIKIAATSYEGMGFAIPSTTVKAIVDDIIQNGYVLGRVEIGVSGSAVTYDDHEFYDLPYGVMIYYITPGGPLDKTDAQQYDIITAINGEEFTDFAELYTILSKYSAGDTVTLTICRPAEYEYEKNEYFEVEVTLRSAY